MTYEERFTRIENAFSTLAEHHARHAEEIAELRGMQKVMILAIERTAESQQEGMKQLRDDMKQLREEMKLSHDEWRNGMQDLRETQRITEEKLHALIDTVDRIIRTLGRN